MPRSSLEPGIKTFSPDLAKWLQIMPLLFVQGYTESPIHQFAPLLTTTIV